MDATLQEVLTLGGAPLLRAAFIIAAIVTIIVNYEKVIDMNGSGQRMQGIQSITILIIAAYMICIIIRYLMTQIESITISGIDFS